MSEKIIVGTRGSKLALAQTEKVVKILEEEGYNVSIKIIKTGGDVLKNKPLHEFKGSGAFVQAIDRALVKGEIDVAVHSYKDVPSKIGGVIAAVLERESPCDAFIGGKIDEIREGAIIGTSSLRREAQLRRYRRDFKIKNLRGNVDTRLRKLKEGEYDAIVIAEAGLIRLGIDIEREKLNPKIFIPSATQGIIAIETRKGEEELVEFMNHKDTFLEAKVERVVLETLGIGCAIPAGIYARKEGGKIKLFCGIYGKNSDEDLVFEESFVGDFIKEAKEFAENIKQDCLKLIERYAQDRRKIDE